MALEDELKKINRSSLLVNPTLYAKLNRGLILYNRKYESHNLVLFEGWRSADRQAELYAQGRTSEGKIVTHAEPWQSWHQYGLAADLARYNMNNKTWSWDFDTIYLKGCMQKVGLTPGPPGDYGHFELTLGFSLEEAKRIQDESGTLALWLLISESIRQIA